VRAKGCATHLHSDWQFRRVNRQDRQIYRVETPLSDEGRHQILASDDDVRLGLREVPGYVRGGQDEAVS
jgi:hypothetical protein